MREDECFCSTPSSPQQFKSFPNKALHPLFLHSLTADSPLFPPYSDSSRLPRSRWCSNAAVSPYGAVKARLCFKCYTFSNTNLPFPLYSFLPWCLNNMLCWSCSILHKLQGHDQKNKQWRKRISNTCNPAATSPNYQFGRLFCIQLLKSEDLQLFVSK